MEFMEREKLCNLSKWKYRCRRGSYSNVSL